MARRLGLDRRGSDLPGYFEALNRQTGAAGVSVGTGGHSGKSWNRSGQGGVGPLQPDKPQAAG